MKIARFVSGDDIRYGLIEGETIVVLHGDPIFGRTEPTGERLPLDDARLLTPIIPRSKVVAVGRNYAAHAAETGSEVPTSPLLFLKPNTAVVGPDDPIVMPDWSERVDYEGELAVVISRMCRNVTEQEASRYIYGFTCANDVTARDIQRAESQWTRAKGFDSSCPLGPWIETDLDPANLRLRTLVNGEVKQDGTTADMVFGVEYLISFISHTFTLLPGDVILTGTPDGIGPLAQGDRVEVEIEGIGTLGNPVVRR